MNHVASPELDRAKRWALFCLLSALALFVAATLAPRSLWVDALKAMAEAALIGALADWFAVTALFRKVPIPFVSRHTAIIPRNKDRIADNLATFVHDKFLDAPSLVALIRRHDPAQKVALWLAAPAHAERLGGYALAVVDRVLDIVDDARIRLFIRDAVMAMLRQVDLSRSVGVILDGLTHEGRHQALLDQLIAQLQRAAADSRTRETIAREIRAWLRREHPLKEKMLPTDWLSDHGAELIVGGVDRFLASIVENDAHELRASFDAAVKRLVRRLKHDPVMAERAETIKRQLMADPALLAYVTDLWDGIRGWLKRDLARPDSVLRTRATAAGAWLGNELATDPALRESLNAHLETLAGRAAPDFAAFLTRHISDTVRGWDTEDMSRQVELNIGKDLQFIRINGTIVGGLIGLVLFGLTRGVEWLRFA